MLESLRFACVAEDAVRFEREMRDFEQRHPGWLASRRGSKKPARAAIRPRKPLTAFMAFLQDKLRGMAAAENIKVKISTLKDLAEDWIAPGTSTNGGIMPSKRSLYLTKWSLGFAISCANYCR